MPKLLQINKSKTFDNFFTKGSDRTIKYVVLHHIADENLNRAIENLKFHQVSSHYIIDDNGEIWQLVADHDIAYQAGVSFWDGTVNLNETSIGIEFFSKNPEEIGFTKAQMKSGLQLCKMLVEKYQIAPKNVVGHSDIAFDRQTGFLNRKDDPSHLFDWKFLAKNGIGIFPKIKKDFKDKIQFQLGDKNSEILNLKKSLKKFGYKIDNLNDEFDEEFKNLAIVFNRRFNKDKYLLDKDKWFISSSKILNVII